MLKLIIIDPIFQGKVDSMTIFRTVKDNNYTVISNTYLKDEKLSFGAIGLMTILLSCKDDTKFSVSLISKISHKSNKVVTKYLNELKRNKYVYVKKKNTRDGFKYEYSIYECKDFNPYFLNISPDTQNPIWESPPMETGNTIINTINKQDKIDKTKLNLCFLTESIIDYNFIKENDINLLSYDNFLSELLKENDNRLVIQVVSYVVKRIKDNDYLDEQSNPIENLLTYFKSSVINNLESMKARADDSLFDDWEE